MYSSADEKKFFDKSQRFLSEDVSLNEYQDLVDLLIFHEWKYYVNAAAIITDTDYDILYKKLENLEIQHPNIVVQNSPTQRVASDLNEDQGTVPHLTPMLSLGNAYNDEDLLDFDKQVKKLTDNDLDIEYNVEPKFDGGSMALVYEDNVLIRAATRGNGQLGEDMTLNAKALPTIPLKAMFSKFGIHKAELRGEAIIPKDVFHKVNAEREQAGLKTFANPRNAAAGGLRMKDPNETRNRGIEVFVFQMSFAEDKDGNDILENFETHSAHLDMLVELGFKVPGKNERTTAKSIKEVIAFSKKWEADRENHNYEIDGMVIKVNAISTQQSIGSTQHHPRWAIAYKFKAKQATTTLQDVEYQVGKVGSITPVAKVEPVFLAGVTISSISLHNEEFIKQKDLRIGDKIIVERAGDVIPYVVQSLATVRDGSEQEIQYPTHCPINDTEEKVALIQVDGEAAWRCPNCVCGVQSLQKIIFHVSKVAMDIDGLGKSLVEKFHEKGWIKDISDVYNLDYNQISELEGFGEKSVENLRKSIDKAKQNPISRLLHSLSIHHLGKKASKLIAEQIDHVLDLRDWTEENFTDIKDIGPVVAKNVIAFFQEESNITLLNKLESYGVNLKQTEEDKPIETDESAPLFGKTILFTGSLQNIKRNEAKKLAEQLGAKNISAVSSNLNILVVGEKAGSKLKKAQDIGTVEIITEEDFLKLVE